MNISPIPGSGTFPYVTDIITPQGHLIPLTTLNTPSTIVNLSPEALALQTK